MVLKWVGTGCKNHEISCVSILLFYSVQHGVLCSDSNSVFQCPIVSFSILLFSSVRGVYGVLQCLWCPTCSFSVAFCIVPVVSMVPGSYSVYGVLQCLWCPTASQWRSVVPVVSMVSYSLSVVFCSVSNSFSVVFCSVSNSFSVVFCSAHGVYGVLQCLWCPTLCQCCSVVPVVSYSVQQFLIGVLQCPWCPIVSTVSHWCSVGTTRGVYGVQQFLSGVLQYQPVVSYSVYGASYSFSVVLCSARGVYGVLQFLIGVQQCLWCLWCPKPRLHEAFK